MAPKTPESERPTEDDIAKKELGPRGVPDRKDDRKMTREKAKNTPGEGEFDGHTA
jgi:hypothetical protein